MIFTVCMVMPALSVFAQDTREASQTTKKAASITIDTAQVSLIQNASIAAPISGVVANVDVSEGDMIDAGKRLVLLSDTQTRAELAAAKAAFEAARLGSENDVDRRYATRTLQVRERELEQSQLANQNFAGSVSQTELDRLRLVVDQSRLAIEQADHEALVAKANANEKQAAMKIAEVRLNRHAVQTTVSGMVTEVNIQPGEWVEAGKMIVRVISLDPIRVECFVDGRKYDQSLVGKTARFTPVLSGDKSSVDAQAKTWAGKVTFVSPELHPVTSQVRLTATIANPDQSLRAGMRGKLMIEE